MNFPRSSGIILHPSSLPGKYGIGDLGSQAYRFVDWLSGAGCKLWQVLPLGPTGYGDSPYQCFSAFAGNPYLISPDFLLHDGLLTDADLADVPDFNASKVDFGRLIPWKLSLLSRAFDHFKKNFELLRGEYEYFCAENASWLDDYALFMSLKEANGGGSWAGWPEPLKRRDSEALDEARKSLPESIYRFTFYQFLFWRQWTSLREYANHKGIQIIGDLPIFVAYDSADVWTHPELFFLDDDRSMTVVAGVPPDIFSTTGQLWGNPLFRWDVHQASGYAWWLERVKSNLKIFDVLRLDHFRGFAGYYEIPAQDRTAENGRWVPGPGSDLFRAIDAKLSDGSVTAEIQLPIIAEDLGLITPDVIALLNEFQLPGMKVLQFGFSGPDNTFLPHNYPANCVAYTGTHDNDTSLGWVASASKDEKDFALRYLRTDGSDFAWDLIRSVWSSVAMFAITPMQDVLRVGGEGRMNFPSRLGGNWEWRMSEDALSDDLNKELRDLNTLYLR